MDAGITPNYFAPPNELSFSLSSVNPAFIKQSSPKALSSFKVSAGILPNRLSDFSSSFELKPRLITLFRSNTFLREIFKSIYTVSFMPGILNTASYTLATSFVVNILFSFNYFILPNTNLFLTDHTILIKIW